jgi:hypothetical protein
MKLSKMIVLGCVRGGNSSASAFIAPLHCTTFFVYFG